MTIASIDIGSNTVLLLLTEFDEKLKTITTLKNVQRIPRLGEGLLPNGRIGPDKINSLLAILGEFNEICGEYNCTEVLVNATNAFRYASNSDEIKDLVKQKYSMNIKTITGFEEGRLTFLGAAFPFRDSKLKTVIDIGGGSTEIIIGDKGKISYQNSFDIGVVSLTEKYFKTLPSSEIILNEAESYIGKIFEDSFTTNQEISEAIAVSGTPTTLSCIKQKIKSFDKSRIDNSIISITDLNIIIDEMKKLKAEDILNHYGEIVSGREDIILAGALILRVVMQRLELQLIKVSTKGLRYGAVIDYLLINKLVEMER